MSDSHAELIEKCERYVIFLDIDGVLLPVPRFTFGGGELSKECVLQLASLIRKLGGSDNVTIVLSSTWRVHEEMIQRLNSFFEEVAKAEQGCKLPCVTQGTPNGTVIVSSVSYYEDDPTERRLVRDRVDEIMRWIHINVQSHPEAIAGRWFAIDDMQLDVDERMRGHFLHTITETGLTEQDVKMIDELFLCSFPLPHKAAELALQAQIDPQLKDEEIQILEIEKARLLSKVNDLEKQLTVAEETITACRVKDKEQEKKLKEQERQIEELQYRVTLNDLVRKNDTMREAFSLSCKVSGNIRKELDAHIKKMVTLTRHKKELEKLLRGEVKQRRNARRAM